MKNSGSLRHDNYAHSEETHSRHHVFANCLHQPLISDLQASMSSGCVGHALGIELRNPLNDLKRHAEMPR
jgi:hypothetical protein